MRFSQLEYSAAINFARDRHENIQILFDVIFFFKDSHWFTDRISINGRAAFILISSTAFQKEITFYGNDLLLE
jgi:hypothetical protein